MSDRSEDLFDLVVMGGGPGGAALATLVAQQGHRVLLLERERFPRHQIGESLLPATIHGVCRMLGVADEIAQAGFMYKLGGSFLWGKNTDPWNFRFDQSPALSSLGFTHAYQVERSKFDTILLRNAEKKGVDVREEHVATDVLFEDGRAVGVRFLDDRGHERVARARYVADAGGHKSQFHSRVGDRVVSPFFRNVAVYGYFEGGKRFPPPREGNVMSAAFRHGWMWYIPLSATLTSVGAVIESSHIDELTRDREASLLKMIEACPIVRDMLSSATRVKEGMYGEVRVRRDWSYCNTKFWNRGLVLIGDAACFIDPLFASGVHLATYAALLAARAINTCLRGDLGEERCFEEFEGRYRLEYKNFHDLLLAFYDQHVDEESYFWVARKILATEGQESSTEAFLRLVAGSSHRAEEFGRPQNHVGPDKAFAAFLHASEQEKKQIAFLSRFGAERPPETPLLEGGLVASLDGFHWAEAASPASLLR